MVGKSGVENYFQSLRRFAADEVASDVFFGQNLKTIDGHLMVNYDVASSVSDMIDKKPTIRRGRRTQL